jgi:hypothetical protein
VAADPPRDWWVPPAVSDHAENSRQVGADVEALLETVGFDAAVCVG